MSIVPPTRIEKIQFYENRIADWIANAPSIGLDPANVADFAGLVSAARMAYNNAETARMASKTATQAFYDAVRSMHNGPGAGSDLIRTIQTFASTTDDPNVYTLADIPAPQPPSEAPAPGTPYDFAVGLQPLGALEITFKCDNPPNTSGTVYEVRRSTDGGSSFTNIGVTGERRFVDETLESGCTQAVYALTAIRSTKRGVTNTVTVRFGVGGASIVSSTSSSGGSVKLAA